uniref:Myb/SANT-like DNA-binding domain-containing protein n=1 Tax=Neolamprologus brichardi TaxID=32507 RepID=A0A3Q4G547_NEOBR
MEPLVHWSHEETRALIGVWSKEKIQRDLEESFRNETVYREMSGRLAALGISRSAKQCRAKIKKLKQEYRNTRRHGERSEAVTKTFRWYDAMDTIMGDKSARTQSREQPSSLVLEVMVPDVEASPPAVTDTPESCTTSTHSLQLTLPRPEACPAGTPQVSSFYSVQLHEFDGPSTSNPVTSTAVQTSNKGK